MKSIKDAVIELAEADRKKHGYKGLYVLNQVGMIYQIDSVFDEGFTNPNGAIIFFASVSPFIPIPDEVVRKIHEIESGIKQVGNKLLRLN